MARLKPKIRKELIMSAAIIVAERMGYMAMRREDIALEADVSAGLITNYFGSMKKFRRSIMRHAINVKNITVISQGILVNDPNALK